MWRRVSQADRLKLECAVEFGLPVDFAGKVLGIESSNTDRILKDLKLRRQSELAALAHQTPEEQQLYREMMHDAQEDAALTALMAVSRARDLGQIKKRNILKLDKKVNESVNRYLAT